MNSQSPKDEFWLPLTLRLPFLSFLFLASLTLVILVSALTGYSARHHGLKNNSDASALLFGWRYSPTLVATVYAILVGSMLNDIRRTEIFARLSRSGGAPATYTLCYPIRAWWNDPLDALSKTKNNGIRSWALWFASTTNILVLLVISPLSAGLLSPATLEIPSTTGFNKASPADSLAWPLDSMDLTMFRTISGGILKQPTSAWLSAEYAVLPVWPQYLNDVPLGSTLNVSTSPEQWTLQTTVYKTELDCIPMTSTAEYNVTVNQTYAFTDGPENYVVNMTRLQLKSDDGCAITIADTPGATMLVDNVPWLSEGGGWWSSGPNYNSSILFGFSNSTGTCDNRSMFFVKSTNSTQLQAHLCRMQYFSADIPITVMLDQTSTQITLDPKEYSQNKRPLDQTKYRTSQLEDAFLSPNWSTKFLSASEAHYAGPLLAIAASPGYNNNPEAMIQSTDMVQRASEMYQQFFGEMLLLELENRLDRRSINSASGRITTTEARIVVDFGVGITLGALLLISTCSIVAVAYYSNLSRRCLNLYQDPGQIAIAASLIVADTKAKSAFAGSGQFSKKELGQRLANSQFSICRGTLFAVSNEDDLEHRDELQPVDSASQSENPTPAILRSWMCPPLLIFLLALLACIATLYQISRTSGVHQAPFVYEFKTQIFNTAATLAPYSILPTLLAVGVKLWIAAVGDTLKRLQPYITMAKAPTLVADSVLVEYLNTPTALVTLKAVKHSHWILALAGLGALATELFTVSISALWTLEIKNLDRSISISRQFEMRQVPRIDEYTLPYHAPDYADVQRYYVLSSIYSSSLQSWLYSATLELTQQASTPSWSKDTWSFVPIDTRNLSFNDASIKGISAAALSQAQNMTLETLAVRARLDCRPQTYVTNTSSWVEEINFKNRTMWNVTNKPPNLDHGYILKGPANMGSGSEYLTCCGNQTNGTFGTAAVGYWSNLDYSDSSINSEDETWSYDQMSMTSKWIVGRPLDMLYQPYPNTTSNPALWIWLEKPQIAAITCTTIIEKANASIEFATDTGVVYDYKILDLPVNATEAWLDKYISHNTSIDYSGDMTYVNDPKHPGLQTSLRKNITTSWGYIFLDSVINSGRAEDVSTTEWEPTKPENLADRAFNFRIRGLNADFMSYSMLQLANNSKEVLLDTDTLISLANKTFGVFFKHFASENVTTSLGGNVYQPIGAKLPWSLGFVTNNTMYATASDTPTAYQGALGIENTTAPTPRSTTAILHIPVEQLVMSPTAVTLCLSLLAFLIPAIAVIFVANRDTVKKLPRDVDTLASTLAFVHGSEKLLTWVQTRSEKQKPWYTGWISRGGRAGTTAQKATMGSFQSADGTQLWGVELCEGDDCIDEGAGGSFGESIGLQALEVKHSHRHDRSEEHAEFLGGMRDGSGQRR
ncbi:hypothetical protein E4T48_00056 [Aureobasidium sp. EXF-10727]|nr:hypothetical protein E4T48_00056 [Aureobasidium sp. EXF-10727]